jgi:hypothetical protein
VKRPPKRHRFTEKLLRLFDKVRDHGPEYRATRPFRPDLSCDPGTSHSVRAGPKSTSGVNLLPVARSKLSIASESSVLSIGSQGSVLSIGSVGSVLSIGSVGSALSIGSAISFGSVFSFASFLSVLSALSGMSRGGWLSWMHPRGSEH